MLDIQKLLAPSTVIKNGKPDGSGMITPLNIVRDMIDMLPDSVWDKNSTFLDPACKSGNFLLEIYKKLINHPRIIEQLGDNTEYRREWILNNQLFGVSMQEFDSVVATRNVYGQLVPNSNIKYIPRYVEDYIKVDDNGNRLRAKLKETFGKMKFDVIVGNPPYNNDIYIKFILDLKDSYNKHMLMITPAKWQAKGGDLNEKFRKEIVPYMSKIVYYPDCIEVFGISENSGITYYLLDNEKHREKTIINKAYFQPLVNSVEYRELNTDDTIWNIGNQIVNKIKHHKKFMLNVISEEDRKKYTICIGKQWCGSRVSSGAWDMKTSAIKPEFVGRGGCIFNPSGNIRVLGKVVGLTSNEYDDSNSSVYVFTSDNKNESLSFYSWITSKFVSFLILINLKGSVIIDDITLKYIPQPEAFDHIFTDEELYKKYNLTQEEINIIESVIKERK